MIDPVPAIVRKGFTACLYCHTTFLELKEKPFCNVWCIEEFARWILREKIAGRLIEGYAVRPIVP